MLKTAIIIPCLDEEASVSTVISRFKSQLSDADIYVIDNGSDDDTKRKAEQSGAIVFEQPLRGKGNALRLAFAQIDADIYIMVDGDNTYDASTAAELRQRFVDKKLDMLVGARMSQNAEAFRLGHQLGNKLFNTAFKIFFGGQLTDIFSGYRFLSRSFVKSFPAISSGFEVETELSVHAVNLGLHVSEVETRYFPRQAGSQSKLRTYRDGFRILIMLFFFLQKNKPFVVFCSFSLLFALSSLVFGVPVIAEFYSTGLVPKFPSLIVSMAFLILSVLSLFTAITTQSMLNFQAENRRLAYLAITNRTSVNGSRNV
jgi:glycosyltransferase involved in cell wall biosynthesis